MGVFVIVVVPVHYARGPWDAIQAAHSAAVCQRRDGCDRAALFALITTDTFLESRVTRRRKRLGTVSTLRVSILRGSIQGEGSLTGHCLTFNDMTPLDVYWVCVALIRCMGSVHTVQTVPLKLRANKRTHLKCEIHCEAS